ncbi:MAG: hypothetical protein RMJ44_12285 [Cytophagales bacterium]|nr:hypothetical protein [Bernardetiaceae bacterium]MDW8211852.1 hypothetical protein [Cytophagales bacterium]
MKSNSLSIKPLLAGCLLYFFVTLACQAQRDSIKLLLEFPLIDFPFQQHATETRGNFIVGYANPSMKQSLAISNNFYNAANYGIKKITDRINNSSIRFLAANGAALLFNLLTTNIPFGVAWLHEEYHRAVLTRRNINSYNDVNSFPIGKNILYVRRIKDEDLIRLYNNHRPDFIRLMSAGLESQYNQVQTLQKQNFFYNLNNPNLSIYWLHTVNNVFYVLDSSNPNGDLERDVAERNRIERDILERDFTGPDFTAWVDALFYPNKPYEARGVHPTGIGINRYITASQLTDEARQYLQRQAALQVVNLFSPHMFGIRRIKLKKTEVGNYYGNFAFRHILTSFGVDACLDIFYQTPRNNLFFSLHRYHNYKNAFFGIEGAIIDKPLLSNRILFCGRTMIWSQPENQSFYTSKAALGGLISIKGTYQTHKWFSPYIEIEAKTKGWVMGNPFIDENVSVVTGIAVRLRK